MDYEKYENQMEYPTKPVKPMLHSKATADEIRAFADKVEDYEKEATKYYEKRQQYNEETGRLSDEFKKDLLQEFGISEHPNADNIYAYAWALGHSGGYSDVYSVINEMSDYKLF